MGQKCGYCGATPDTAGNVNHTPECTLKKIGLRVPGGHQDPAVEEAHRAFKMPPEGIEHGPFMGPMLRKPDGAIERRVRDICREEIAQHLEMARNLQAFGEAIAPPKECEQCAKLRTMLGMARSALAKVVGMDPRAAAQRAQMHMPAEHDIARMTLTEIERMEAEGGLERDSDGTDI